MSSEKHSKEDLIKYAREHSEDGNEIDEKLISKAYDFGKKLHGDQKRLSGANYFDDHCINVTYHVIELGMDSTLISAALLHDTIEDTDITAQDIEKEFGKEIASLVEGVSKLGKIKYHGNERHVESLRKFFVSVADDVRVVILKLADRWHNLETLEFLPEEKQQRIALESIMIHAPLASRLGMGKLVNILNDLAFPYAYPDEYTKTKELRDSKLANAEITMQKIHTEMSNLLENSLGYLPKIDERVKGLYSLYKKMERKNWNDDEIYDLIAIRTIVKSIPDCYQALGTVHSNWRPVPGRVKDYIAVPKPNGYQSLHTAVFSGDGSIVEVQFRTEDMHYFNEFGVASHHNYKSEQFRNSKKESFAWIEQLGEFQNADLSPADYIKRLRTDFFQDRIFVFTPKGDVIDLPIGATVLDYAYVVHTQIGEHAGGGKINGEFKALKTPLNNEDIVEIVVNPKAHPTDKWLDQCVTSNAIGNIRRYIKKVN